MLQLGALNKRLGLLSETLARCEVKWLHSGLKYHCIPLRYRRQIPEPAQEVLTRQLVITDEHTTCPDLYHWIEQARNYRDKARSALHDDNAESAEEHLEIMDELVYQAGLDCTWVESQFEDLTFDVTDDGVDMYEWDVPEYGDTNDGRFEGCYNFILNLPECLDAVLQGVMSFEDVYNIQTLDDDSLFQVERELRNATSTLMPLPTESEIVNVRNAQPFREELELLEDRLVIQGNDLPPAPPNSVNGDALYDSDSDTLVEEPANRDTAGSGDVDADDSRIEDHGKHMVRGRNQTPGSFIKLEVSFRFR